MVRSSLKQKNWPAVKRDLSAIVDDITNLGADIAKLPKDIIGKRNLSNQSAAHRDVANTLLTLLPKRKQPKGKRNVTEFHKKPVTHDIRSVVKEPIAAHKEYKFGKASSVDVVKNQYARSNYPGPFVEWFNHQYPDGVMTVLHSGTNGTKLIDGDKLMELSANLSQNVGFEYPIVTNVPVTPGTYTSTPLQVDQYLSSKKRLIGIEENPGPKVKKTTFKKKIVRPIRSVVRTKRPAPVALSYDYIQRNKMKSTHVQHVEQVCEVLGSTSSYSLQLSSILNPGLYASFPWMSSLSAQYESYQFKSLEYIFMPYVSSATSGYISMNVDYNPTDLPATEFPTKQSFTDYDGAQQGNSWEAMSLRVRCPNKEGPDRRSVRYGSLTGAYDLHNYDHGTFNIAVGAQASAIAIGTLFVSYTIEFYRPRLAPSSSLGGFADLTMSSSTPTVSIPFGTGTRSGSNNIPVTLSTTDGTITFNRVGRFWIDYSATGTVLVANTGAATYSTLTNVTVISIPVGIVDSGALKLSLSFLIVDVASIGGTIVLAPMSSCTTVSFVRLSAFQIPGNLSAPDPVSLLKEKLEKVNQRLDSLEEKESQDQLTIDSYYVSTPVVLSSSTSSLASGVSRSMVSKR